VPAIDPQGYWMPVCEIVRRPRCWLRLAWVDGAETNMSRWDQGLGMPIDRYLEGPDGPLPIRHVMWVQVMPVLVRGGLAGRPLEFVEMQDEVVASMRGTRALWTLREEQWSVEGLFESRPGLAIHIANPFRTGRNGQGCAG
jgi:hypothetical protein